MQSNEINSAPPAIYNAGGNVKEDKVLAKARAILEKRLSATPQPLTSPSLVRDFLAIQMHGKEREVFAVIFLDTQNRLIKYEELFQGTVDRSAVYQREIVRAALLCNAAAVILAHNHPSGVTTPSEADKKITQLIQAACEVVEIRVLDHLIVGSSVLSFAEQGLL